jgi:hypothetical protein
MPHHVLHRLERIDFTGKLAGVAIAPVKVQFERICRRKLAPAVRLTGNESNFRKRIAAAMKP